MNTDFAIIPKENTKCLLESAKDVIIKGALIAGGILFITISLSIILTLLTLVSGCQIPFGK